MTWIPDHEVYCPACHRMVAAEASGLPSPAAHFRWSVYYEGRIKCSGWATWSDREITHGMEDPAAAWYESAAAYLAASTTVVSQSMIRISGATTSASSPSAKLRWWNRS